MEGNRYPIHLFQLKNSHYFLNQLSQHLPKSLLILNFTIIDKINNN